MKISKIYCRCIVTHKGQLSYNFSENTKIDYVPEMRAYMLDDITLVPESNVNHASIEQPKVEIPVIVKKSKKGSV